MKRYYISPIVGTGAEDDPYRPKVADYGVSWVGVIPSNPDTGRPVYPWCLALVEAINHASLLADRDIKPLPDFPLDGKVSAINKATRNRMSADLQGRASTRRSLAPPMGTAMLSEVLAARLRRASTKTGST